MKKFQSLAIIFFALSSAVFAQDKLLTLDDIFNPDAAKRVRFGGMPVSVQWSPDGKSFKQMIGGKLMRVDAVTSQAVPYLDSDSLSAALQRVGVKAADASLMANSPFLEFNADETAIVLSNANDLWLYETATRSIKRLTNDRAEELEASFSPDGKYVSFVRGNNLFVVDTKGSEKQLTRDGKEGDNAIYNGYLDWVYEEELYGRGQKRGYWWSPDSRFIAFLRTDESPVPKFILTNDLTNDQVIERTDYPQAGDGNPIVRLGVADVGKTSILPNAARIPKIGEKLPPTLLRVGDAVKFIDTSAYKPDDLLIARVAWNPDSKSVLFQALNREQTTLDLNSGSVATGKITKVITETTPAWVEVYDNPVFTDTSAANGMMVWQSARNGWKHLYLYDSTGQLVRQLTNGKWEVRTLYGVDNQNGWVYFSATKDSHIAENIYRVRLTGGEVERVSKGDGWHAAAFNKTFSHYVENWSNVITPTQTRLFKADGSLERVIQENRVDALRNYRLSTPEFLNVKTRDGFNMEAMMIKPPDFDPSRKYPVLQFTYAGPHAPSVANRWGGNRGMWFQMLAQKGYIIWVCDNRTASGKGEESVWPLYAYKGFGELELRDIEDGLNYLKSTGFVDMSRIGLHGWSFGGFMTSYALTHSGSFKIGMAGGTVADWTLYDSVYTERYMKTPLNNREGYEKSNVVKAAANLSGRLLLIHGVMDDNVHMQNVTKLTYALQQADKQFDLMLYPNQRHGVAEPALVKHWYTMMTDYVLKNL
ncbi:MAG: DPP IV N-terminal domain-containing protein [Pyrinomonadaceae bacterium]